MDDKEITGQVELIKLIIWIAIMAIPVALLTLIFLALYTVDQHLMREMLPAAFRGFLVSPSGGSFMSMEFTGSLTYPIYTNLIAAIVAGLISTQLMLNFTGLVPRNNPGSGKRAQGDVPIRRREERSVCCSGAGS